MKIVKAGARSSTLAIAACVLFSLSGCGTFYDAVRRGDISEVQNYLAKGTDINVRDQSGNTALIVASLLGDIELVRLLTARGADLNAPKQIWRNSVDGCI